MTQNRDPEGDRGLAPFAGAGPTDVRALIHEFNNLLGGLLNSIELLRRAGSEGERGQALTFITSAGTRIQALLPNLRAAFSPEGSAQPGRKTRGPAAQRPIMRKVLIAEDEEMNRTLLRKVLDGTGLYETTEAKDGAEALEAYKRARPDLVLLDIAMPGLTGTQVLERLNQMDAGARVLLLSGYVSAQDPITRSPNVVGFLQKPVEMQTLLKTLGRLFV